MYIAQKILKSMASITNEIHEENNELDDLIFTPKSGNISQILSPPISARQPSLTPPTDDNFTIDSPSEIAFGSQLNASNSIVLKINFKTKSIAFKGLNEMVPSQVLEATSIIYQAPPQADPIINSTPGGSIDTFDFP